EFGTVAADAELGFADAADHAVRGQAVAIGRPGPHEIRAAAGEDPAGEAVAVQQAEQLQHRLVHRGRVGSPEARVPGRGQPAPAGGVEFPGGEARVGEGQQLGQGLHPSRVQLLKAVGWPSSAARSSAKTSWAYTGCSVHNVPSLSNTATRSRSGTKSGASGSVTAAM